MRPHPACRELYAKCINGQAPILMPNELILPHHNTNTQLGPLAEIADRASEFIQQSKAKNTIRAYRADWSHFEGWCKAHGQCSLPATANTDARRI